MAWDSKAALASRRRTNSSASRGSISSVLTLQQMGGPSTPVQPKSAHVSDPFLQEFLQPGFDPAAYWNATLGGSTTTSTSSSNSAAGVGISRTRSPAPSSTSTSGAAGRLAAAASSATATADRAAQAQATLSQLGAHTSRLTTVLTQLTDDILRSGRRLAYEVQLLRGETLGLGEVVEKHLALLEENEVNGATAAAAAASGGDTKADGGEADTETGAAAAAAAAAVAAGKTDSEASSSEPASLAQLRMLAQVRSRLDAVIRMFGEAMEFIMPPSAISVTSSFLSVSGPDQESGGGPGRSGQQDAANTTSMEDKGQNVLRGLRDEIARLLDGANVNDGAEAAAARVEALRNLCRVWAGTAEEKARLKFVDTLQRMVEDKQKELDRERERLERLQKEKLDREAREGGGSGGAASGAGQGGQSDASASSGTGTSRGYAAAGYGFISQLQKIRSGL